MFVFWSVVWALVILSSLNSIFHWDIPEELQLPKILLKTIGGMPSFYGYRFDFDVENVDDWLKKLVEKHMERLPSVQFKQSLIPKCSLTQSSKSTCMSFPVQNCNQFEERCIKYWQRKAGRRTIRCFDQNKNSLNCDSNGYFVQTIQHNKDQMILFMSKSITQTIKIEQIQDCQTHFVKQDNQTLLYIPIPEMQSNSKTAEIPLRQTTKTAIFYPNDQYSQNLTILWTLIEAHLNSNQFCTCKRCFELQSDLQIDMEKNQSLKGLTGQLFSVSNKSTLNLTTNWQGDDVVGVLDFRMDEKVIDTITPLFWRRPGRFECPSEITCPLELFYIFEVQSGLIITDYLIEIAFVFALIVYQCSDKKL